MRENRAFYINTALHMLLIFLLATLQTSLWYKLFSGFPAPFFWIHFITYISIYREPKEAFIIAFIGFIAISSFTVAPHGTLFLIGLLLMLFFLYLKNRVFWPGPSYYLLLCGIGTVLYVILYYMITILFEETVLPDVRWLYLFLQICLTTLISPIFYFIYQILDRLTGKEQLLPMEEAL